MLLARREGPGSGPIPTVAAVLLFGGEAVLKSAIPSAETVLAQETSISTPLTGTSWLNVLSSLTSYGLWIQGQLPRAELPGEAIREVLLNAYLHRCYRTQAPVQIHVRIDEIEIQNPGGLLVSCLANIWSEREGLSLAKRRVP